MRATERDQLVREAVSVALRHGATSAEVLLREGSEFAASVRLGELERLQQADFRKLGIRVLCGRRSAVTATSDFSAGSIESLARDAVTMASSSTDDASSGIPESSSYDASVPQVALHFPSLEEMGFEDKVAIAARADAACLTVDPRVSNTEGAQFADTQVRVTYANSAGICRSYRRSEASLTASAVASAGGQMQRDYWTSLHADPARLAAPESVGTEAGRRAVRKLGARKVGTREAAVVLDPLAAASLLRSVADAVSGPALLRRASFLSDSLGLRVGPAWLTIVDDPLLEGAPASRPFDSEGVPSRQTEVVRHGVLESYLLDTYAARKLGLKTTGSSNRDPQGAPSAGPSNFFIHPGEHSPDEIVRSVRDGLYVTELFGFGSNVVSGEFSQGAAGLWIENGELTFPVEEVTVAGNIRHLLESVEAVGNDLVIHGSLFAPTLLVGKMVIGGS